MQCKYVGKDKHIVGNIKIRPRQWETIQTLVGLGKVLGGIGETI